MVSTTTGYKYRRSAGYLHSKTSCIKAICLTKRRSQHYLIKPEEFEVVYTRMVFKNFFIEEALYLEIGVPETKHLTERDTHMTYAPVFICHCSTMRNR